ncbi:NAD(P)-dependent oxidoreductase [Deinococcus deserti]|uniref:Putative Nucleoside-diphosphate-sugar epimerases putative Epimerase, NAD dependent epimerase/dehydratase family n=1 Tax=Deinococcus deserti (strain DSM 17065 / CIP 109153 / LMG 22923 / VCD115) TaxID=546414 RepID=C1D405_DEIDV|nr:NAD(P)-dependent oxidoreductase [Deinococcus deserti]ACO48234.1 putative Nucleoside-diphosphate-sugar epimerases; putative Epimerase, NAD dependent epimerase/dehydratase family [Deinococcus deserti VCD115]
MKVLITGAGGNLGRVLAPALAETGYTPVLMDFRPLESPHQCIQGDATSKADVFAAAEGVDVIVHGAALHGVHLSNHSRDDFWKLNMEGTYHVYEAARAHGIKKVLLCSTMGVYGASVTVPDDSFAVVTEDLPCLPGDFYGMTKTLAEELAGFYSRSHDIRTISYRLGMFVPENFVRYGFRLLKGGVDDRDVAQAFLLGLKNDTILYDAFNIMAAVPFSLEQLPQWRQDPRALVESQFPGISELVNRRGEDIDQLLRSWGHVYWSIEKARRELGYQPAYTFTEFYSALKSGNDAHYPFADLPWWGVPEQA